MTEELEFSVMMHGPTFEEDMRLLLQNFEQENRVHVKLTFLPWETAWSELMKYALFRTAPDVSEIGSTWMPSLVGMDTLEPVSAAQISKIGGEDAFLNPIWQSAFIDKKLYGVPWFADTRLIYYRRDLFEQVGLDPAQVFQSAKNLIAAVDVLQVLDPITPWIVPTVKTTQSIHIVAPWVWGAGGDFLSPDGSTILFDQPAALAGFCDYFRLGRYLKPEIHLDISDGQYRFYKNKVAMIVSGPWMGLRGMADYGLDVVQENYGVAPTPGISFIGGSHLVIWKNSKKPELARKLVQYLAYADMQRGFYKTAIMLPTRNEVLQSDMESHHGAVWQASVKALYNGRCFPSVRLWSKLEETVSAELANIWAEIVANPQQNADEIVVRHISSVAERLKITFGG